VDWKYLSDTRAVPESGVTGTTVHFTVPASASACNVRWYANDTMRLLATSGTVTVLVPTITAPATVVSVTTLSVTVANGPGNPTDWVALYCPTTQPDGAYVDWKYLSDTQVAPGSGQTGATVHFTVPASASACNVRWYANDTMRLLATSGTVTVLVPTITVPATVAPGGALSVTVANGPGSPTDWVGLYCPTPQPDGAYVDWKYLSDTQVAPGSGLTAATVHLAVPASVTVCEVRWFGHDTFMRLATSTPVAVQ
jgi:hypothetical protein